MYKVLVVCTGNICRSPMAAGMLHHYLPLGLRQSVEVASAGTHALHGHQAHEHAVDAMASIGIDIRSHRARQITGNLARRSDLILVMETMHAGIVKRLLGWSRTKPRLISEFNPRTPAHDIEDPYGATLKAYVECIRTLHPCIQGVVQWLDNNIR